MPLELHVWGPAFSVPSIDAQCIAAIAYFTQAVPRGEWVVVASGEVGVSPTHELPALRNENVWVGGFRNIIDYVRKYSGGRWDLDAELEGRDKADCVAFSSFVEANGQPLLDLSLYVSTQNYTAVTRPLYSTIQPFPLPYITPSSLRSVAKQRTSHLGLSSLDIDSEPTTSESKDESVIPPSLRKPRVTISSLLSQSPENAAQIRLDALAVSFFEPLQFLRGKKRFFLSQSPTSLDCLALGYLSLAFLPDLPSPWLSNCMRAKFPQLCAFVHDLQKVWFGGAVTLQEAYLVSPSQTRELAADAEKEVERRRRANGKGALPWSPPDRGSVLALGKMLVSNIADSIPLVSSLRQTTRLKNELDQTDGDEEDLKDAKKVVSTYQKDYIASAASVLAGVGLFVGAMFYYGLITLGGGDDLEEEQEKTDGGAQDQVKGGLGAYGAAGEALEALAQAMDFGNAVGTDRTAQEPVEVEVEVMPEPVGTASA